MKHCIALLVLVTAACGGMPVEPVEDNERLGVIKFENEPTNISVPETANVGEPMTVSVVSWGTELCITKGRTRVTQTGSTVIVEPIDSLPNLPAGALCPSIVNPFSHEATVAFPEAGSITVMIRGREMPGDKLYSERYSVQVR